MLFPVAARAAEPVLGRWVTQNQKAVVQIEPCGAAMCGRIVKLLPKSDVGKTMDERNSDAKLRTRPLVGLPIFLNMKEDDHEWRGRLYDPQYGNTYSSVISRNADGTLRVKGCFFIICKTQTWHPAS
ncbi:MAG: DUF2147 domain-containing protein [Pseudomonadota bacterium]|uniref:DUF2147 domain-containing protein n=1 Tax=Sphingomonas sp. ERG5 TaxID=1381597 RepID=UPI00126A46B6|nr:DUF2147 domain-containing protein [Sphingomonas sp. ERG5]